MSAIITCVLKLSVGLLSDKIRQKAAGKLGESGDLTDERCRQIIIRELDDIKSTLDALIRKDLLSSVEFFRDGMTYLEMALQNASSITAARNNISTFGASSLSALGEDLGNLNIASGERFKKAREKFKTAGEEATRAFSNPASSMEDKILATKLRVICAILESFDDIRAAVKATVMYVERLHDLPAIQESFSVYLDGGFKSIFSKTKRLEIVQAVAIINLELYDFARMSSPFRIAFAGVKVVPRCSVVTSEGDVIILNGKATIFVFFSTPANARELHRKFCSLPTEDQEKIGFAIESMAIDAEDNLYVLGVCQGYRKEIDEHIVYVFDSKGVLKNRTPLVFLTCHQVFFLRASIAVNKRGQIVLDSTAREIYIFDHDGQLLCKFLQESRFLSTNYLAISDVDEIITARFDQRMVYVHTAEGKYNRTFLAPQDHKIAGIAFSHTTKSIILLTSTTSNVLPPYCLLSYGPMTDKPLVLPLNFGKLSSSCHLTSHPTGFVVLVMDDSVLFIE